MVAARRHAAHQIWVGIGDDARQDGDPKPERIPDSNPPERRVMHRDLLFEPERPSARPGSGATRLPPPPPMKECCRSSAIVSGTPWRAA